MDRCCVALCCVVCAQSALTQVLSSRAAQRMEHCSHWTRRMEEVCFGLVFVFFFEEERGKSGTG